MWLYYCVREEGEGLGRIGAGLVSGVWVLVLFVAVLGVALYVPVVKGDSGTIYIRADGSIDPPTAPIQRNGNIYNFTDNIDCSIVIERDNIVIDGGSYTIQGTGDGTGINVTKRENVTIKNMKIRAFWYGIYLYESSNNNILRNNVTDNCYGVWLDHSSSNSIYGNNATSNNYYGIRLDGSSNNTVLENNVENNGYDFLDTGYGIQLWASYNNTISRNNALNNDYGIFLVGSSNVLRDNVMIGNRYNFVVVEGALNDVDSSNTVDGKPVYYWINEEDKTVPLDAGFVALINCTNITVQNLNLTNNGQGILLAQTTNSKISQNNVTANDREGIRLFESSNNIIFGNNLTDTEDGISLYDSNYNTISGNKITNTRNGISLDSASHNSVFGNNVATSTENGIKLDDAEYNSVRGNKITNNKWSGICLWESHHNSVYGNNIANNDVGLRLLFLPEENSIYHNNFVNNTEQAKFAYIYQYGQPMTSFNVWDDGYPSGGNYWSDYNGTDSYSGAYQNETGSDGVGDTPYVIDPDNRDNYPLISLWTAPAHELIATITAPTFMRVGDSISLEAIVTNEGLNDEASVKLELLINGTMVDSITIPTLKPYFPHTLSHLWTPSNEGTCNVTAYVNPLSGETSIENNKATKIIVVGPPLKVGVKAGDWIKVDYTITGWPAGTPYPLWLKVEFMSIVGTNVTVRVTMRMSDGTEQNATVPVDVVAGGQALGLSGFVIPANATTGDSIYISGYGNVTIAGETTRTYAGASRTVVYTSFSQYGPQLTYYWDKQTGVLVEATVVSGSMTTTGKATETNMWQATPAFPIDPTLLCILIAIVAATVGAIFLTRRKKKLPESPKPEA
jgi:parallel beta-helix repeat protein